MRKIWKALRLYLLVCGIGINVFVLWMEAGWPVFIDRWLDVSEQPLKAEAIVCLGEGSTGNRLPLDQGWKGIHTALELYHDGWAEKVVFSGGGGGSMSEGELYAEAAEWLGLPGRVWGAQASVFERDGRGAGVEPARGYRDPAAGGRLTGHHCGA